VIFGYMRGFFQVCVLGTLFIREAVAASVGRFVLTT
jgi:hypothetical protein